MRSAILTVAQVAELIPHAEVSIEGDRLISLIASHEYLRMQVEWARAVVQGVRDRMRLSADPTVWQYADTLAAAFDGARLVASTPSAPAEPA